MTGLDTANKVLKVVKNKQVQKWVIGSVIAMILGFLLNVLVFKAALKKDYGYCGYVLWIAICFIVFFLCQMRAIAIKRMEMVFAVIALILGVFYIAVSPATVGVSWDDEVHYGRTVSLLSYLSGGKYYYADEDQITSYQNTIASYTDEQKSGFNRENRRNVSEKTNREYSEKVKGNNPQGYESFSSIAYIPAALGILSGRILRLSWVACFNLGRFFNLLCYVFVTSLAIKKLHSGKLLCALVGLIPSTIFMAGSYSYDPWVISWSLLGFAEFFNAVADDDQKISVKQWMKMLLTFAVGFLPKMVYVVTLFPLLFVKSEKFENPKKALALKMAVILMAVLLALSYFVPEMIRGALAVGDSRGGTNVSTIGQMHFILAHSGNVASIILHFFIQYAGLSIVPYTQLYAYLGIGSFDAIIFIILFTSIFLENTPEHKVPFAIKLTGIIGLILGVFSVIMSMYMSFNPVGAQTIAGVQNRYLFPLFFPLGYYLIPRNGRIKWEKENVAVYPIAAFAFSFIYNVYTLCIVYY